MPLRTGTAWLSGGVRLQRGMRRFREVPPLHLVTYQRNPFNRPFNQEGRGKWGGESKLSEKGVKNTNKRRACLSSEYEALREDPRDPSPPSGGGHGGSRGEGECSNTKRANCEEISTEAKRTSLEATAPDPDLRKARGGPSGFAETAFT